MINWLVNVVHRPLISKGRQPSLGLIRYDSRMILGCTILTEDELFWGGKVYKMYMLTQPVAKL